MENNNVSQRYTEDELMARLKFFIGICLALTLFGIVFVVLYSLIFVTQPLNAISPIDQKFFELIIPIATFLTGTLSGIMLAGGDKDLKAKALDAANKSPAPASSIGQSSIGGSGFGASATIGGFSASYKSPTMGMGQAGGTTSGFGAPAADSNPFGGAPAAPMMSSTGKPMPFQPPQPEL